MKAVRWIAAAIVAAALLWWLWPRVPLETRATAVMEQPPSHGGPLASGSPGALPSRDLFRYADADGPPVRAFIPVPEQAGLATPASTPSPGLRLVGFVSQASGLHAALALDGRVVLVGVGDTIDGYAILAVDAERGVSVRTPDGTQRLLEAR